MDLKSKRHRLMTVVATAAAFGVLGLSLSVVAFGQSTTTTGGDYTQTVPTATTPGDYTQTVPTTSVPAQAPATTTTQQPAQENNSATTPSSGAAPETATGTSPNVAAAPTASTPKALAFTGFNPLPLLIVGLLLVGTGAFVQLRRRRDV